MPPLSIGYIDLRPGRRKKYCSVIPAISGSHPRRDAQMLQTGQCINDAPIEEHQVGCVTMCHEIVDCQRKYLLQEHA